MAWWRKRGEQRGADAERGESARVSGRRDFFRLGAQELRGQGLEALRFVGEASRAVQEAMTELEREARLAAAEDGPETAAERQARERAEARRPAPPRQVVRPPGALPEADFLRVCEGCRRCVEACPEDAIVPATDAARAGRVGTPTLPLQRIACALCVDVPCAAACPTGALRPIPVAEIRIGRAEVMRNLCLNHLGQACQICVDHCPIGEAALAVGPDGFPVVGADACTGCGQCVVRCPTYPAAIRVVPT